MCVRLTLLFFFFLSRFHERASGRGITLYRTIRFKERIQCIGPSKFTGPRESVNVIPNWEECITGNYWAIIPTGWLWAMPRMMLVPNCCPGNAGYRPCRFPSGGWKIPGIEYVPFSCLHNTLVNFMTVV